MIRKVVTEESVVTSVTRLGDFWNFLATNFITKVVQMIGNFLGNFENHRFLSPTVVAACRATFGQTWATFIPASGHTGCDAII